MYLGRKGNARLRSASIQKSFLFSYGLTASVSLCRDGWSSGEDMGQKNKVGSFRETFPTPRFCSFCRLRGGSDHFQSDPEPTHNHLPSMEFGRSSTGKAVYKAKNKDLNFCM